MAVRTKPTRTCSICRSKLEARMIPSFSIPLGGSSTVLFAKTLPVFICEKCDRDADAQQPPNVLD